MFKIRHQAGWASKSSGLRLINAVKHAALSLALRMSALQCKPQNQTIRFWPKTEDDTVYFFRCLPVGGYNKRPGAQRIGDQLWSTFV